MIARFSLFKVSCFMALATGTAARAAVVVVSNLAEPADGTGWAVFGGQTIGMKFTTGTTSALWTLDGVDLVAVARLAPGLDFTVSLHTESAFLPGPVVISFTGPDPTLSGTYHYSPSAPVVLTGGTTYWITAASPTSLSSNDGYAWARLAAMSASVTGPSGWSIGYQSAVSFNQGTSWSGITNPARMALYATAVPEPSPALLSVLFAGAGVLSHRRREAVFEKYDGPERARQQSQGQRPWE
jgi:hypothetical protein